MIRLYFKTTSLLIKQLYVKIQLPNDALTLKIVSILTTIQKVVTLIIVSMLTIIKRRYVYGLF